MRACSTTHREQLGRLAATLLEKETLDEVDAYRAAGLPSRHEPTARRIAAIARNSASAPLEA